MELLPVLDLLLWLLGWLLVILVANVTALAVGIGLGLSAWRWRSRPQQRRWWQFRFFVSDNCQKTLTRRRME